jgi:hypothetical protein
MIKGEKFYLADYPSLEVFSDISNFVHRKECINLVIRGIKNTLLRINNKRNNV